MTKRINILLLQLLLVMSVNALAADQDAPKPLSIKLQKGQVLSLVAPIPKDDGSKHLKAYYEQAFPLANNYGLQNQGRLKTTKTLVGKFTPSAWTLFTWPSEDAMQSFEKDPKWPKIKALRSLAWDELKIASAVVEEDKVLNFSSDKYYTLAFAWFNSEKPNSYFQYLKNIEDILPSVGGKFIHMMRSPIYEVHASSLKAPGQITFVEWDTIDGLQKLQANEDYQAQLGLLREGTTGFELHIVELN